MLSAVFIYDDKIKALYPIIATLQPARFPSPWLLDFFVSLRRFSGRKAGAISEVKPRTVDQTKMDCSINFAD